MSLLVLLVLALYMFAAIRSGRRHEPWPIYRHFFWIFGVLSAAAAITGPLAHRAHMEFTAHMAGHLLLGMLAPLLIALAAPMTLVLRSFSVQSARRLTAVLKSKPLRIISDPLSASLLNVGGLWVLYTTNIYQTMHHSLPLHLLVHIHVFLAGYIFTVSMIYIDPAPHRTRFLYRGVIMVAAFAGHGILSKHIYIHPPAGVPPLQAEAGGMLMYYGGDVIDAVLIFIFCCQWYRDARPRSLYHYRTP